MMTGASYVDFDSYVENLPLLHTWDGGATWNSGGFPAFYLQALRRAVREHFGERPLKIIETGAGNSTITFLYLEPAQLVSVAPSDALRNRIIAYCDEAGIDASTLDYRVARSELELPRMALGSGHTGWGAPKDRPKFDLALIDGGHGWPTVFVDFCYLNLMLSEGGLLVLDDVQLHSIAELSRLLRRQPGFELRHDLLKLQIWEKTNDDPFLPDHSREPYIVQRTQRLERTHELRARVARRIRLRRQQRSAGAPPASAGQ
jgi:predicted O-methyltransferase YrrM